MSHHDLMLKMSLYKSTKEYHDSGSKKPETFRSKNPGHVSQIKMQFNLLNITNYFLISLNSYIMYNYMFFHRFLGINTL